MDISNEEQNVPWKKELDAIVKKYSTTPDYRPFDMIAEWQRSNLFQKFGEKITNAVPFEQSIDEYIQSFHSMSSLTRDAMGDDNAKSFDDEVRKLLESFGDKGEGTVRMKVSASIIWGKPIA